MSGDSSTGGISPKLKKLFVYRDNFGFANADLIDLAEIILRRDVESLKDLDDGQLTRMLDACEGAALIIHLLQERAG